jgi:hypothetical protein
LPYTPSRYVGPCALHVSFEWTSSMVDTGYAKHEDPMGRVFVSRHHHGLPPTLRRTRVRRWSKRLPSASQRGEMSSVVTSSTITKPSTSPWRISAAKEVADR